MRSFAEANIAERTSSPIASEGAPEAAGAAQVVLLVPVSQMSRFLQRGKMSHDTTAEGALKVTNRGPHVLY